MFTLHTYIDYFQLTKKNIISQIITDEEIKSQVNTIVDDQTKLAKDWVDITTTLARALFDNLFGSKKS
jgi:hypothetical protein